MIIGALEKRMAMGPTGAADDSWYFPGGSFCGGSAGGAKTKSGAMVSEQSAMKLAVFWCCVKILSEDVASLPLHLYRRLPGGGKERAVDHPLYYLLHDKPNPEMTSMSGRECGQAHLLTWGNKYSEIEWGAGRLGRNQVKALWPITPNRVTPRRNERKEIEYKISMPGSAAPVVLPKRNVLHTPGLGFNGLVGYNPVAYARETLGLGLGLEEYSELYFGNGTHPGVVVSHPNKLSPQAHDNLKQSLTEAHSGLGKSHRLLLLEEAMKIEKIGIDNKDSQFIESKKYSNIDIGTRIMRVPPYMYGEMEKSAWANVEQQAIDYVVKTLRPWLVREEQTLNTTLLSPEEQRDYFFEHLIDGLMRGDIESRYNAYAVARNNGWMNADEIRELENMNPMPNGQGKIYLVPLNMIPATEAGKSQSEPKQQNNRSIYRSRLENAYSRLISDAIGRVTRKEAQRVNWIRKNQGNNGAMSQFYREFPDYIKKQAFPVFLSFAESLTGMESELNGLKYDSFKAEIERFIDLYCSNFAGDYVETSQNLAANNGEWKEREAAPIAETQTKSLADAYIQHLHALTGMNS